MVYLWRAVDYEGTVLDVVVQRRRNTKAATRLLRKLLRNHPIKPTRIVTDVPLALLPISPTIIILRHNYFNNSAC